MVRFDAREAGRHVDQKPIAAQDIAALGEHDAAPHRDEIGLGIEHSPLTRYGLVLLGHHDIAVRLDPADRRAGAVAEGEVRAVG